jgi:hypothetical protein
MVSAASCAARRCQRTLQRHTHRKSLRLTYLCAPPSPGLDQLARKPSHRLHAPTGQFEALWHHHVRRAAQHRELLLYVVTSRGRTALARRLQQPRPCLPAHMTESLLLMGRARASVAAPLQSALGAVQRQHGGMCVPSLTLAASSPKPSSPTTPALSSQRPWRLVSRKAPKQRGMCATRSCAWRSHAKPRLLTASSPCQTNRGRLMRDHRERLQGCL